LSLVYLKHFSGLLRILRMLATTGGFLDASLRWQDKLKAIYQKTASDFGGLRRFAPNPPYIYE
jgi:hypothetical protein